MYMKLAPLVVVVPILLALGLSLLGVHLAGIVGKRMLGLSCCGSRQVFLNRKGVML